MKRIIITLIFIIFMNVLLYSQISENQPVLQIKNTNYFILMPVSELYRILGNPLETRIIDTFTVLLKYSDIWFFHCQNLGDSLVRRIIFTDENIELNFQKVIGFSKDIITMEFGDNRYIMDRDEHTYFIYEFLMPEATHIELVFRFNALGVCELVSLSHSSMFV